ncbi:MAG: beta-lactamase family protein [Eubacteriales bacterium]|nr:beta-lactamase family protein [Eubacteriales bacterium]
MQKSGETPVDLSIPLRRVLKHHHVVGSCVQLLRNDHVSECYSAGFASLSPSVPVDENTYFRTASVAKMVLALLVMRLQTLGLLNVQEDISAFWGALIRNPHSPETPIPLSSLLSHTSGIVDSPLYFRSFLNPVSVNEILADAGCFAPRKPLKVFEYSNFAAGLCGCLLEKRFDLSLEALARRHLFVPLYAHATFDLSTLAGKTVADDYRVLPASHTPAFSAHARLAASAPLGTPDPQTHYMLASGSLFLTAEALLNLSLPLIDGRSPDGKIFLSPTSLRQMKTPLSNWPEPDVRMRHGMGLLELDDPAVFPGRLYGHQGFAYGAVNGVFITGNGNGFVSLNSGASEQRVGHLSCLNRDLIRVCLAGD